MPVSGKRIALKQDVEALSRKLQNMINQAVGGQQGASSPSAPAWGGITGTLSAQTDLNSALGGKVGTGDSRLSDARTPTAHSQAPADVTGTAVVTADSRLSDSRTPTSHGNALHTVGVTAGASAPGDYAAEGSSASVARADHRHSRESFGTGAGTICQGNDSRLSDTRNPDVNFYRHYGVTNYEAWYTSPRSGTALSGTALVAARMYAMPFLSPKAITLDRIGVYVSTLSTTTARLGIYADGGNCYPGSLLLDAGTIDVTSTGAKTITISQALAVNTLCWLVIVCAATPAIYCIPVAGVINVLGTSNALGTAMNCGLYVAQTYGALPGTFPSSPTLITAAPIPAIFVRLSA
jgi:hypothetical protein